MVKLAPTVRLNSGYQFPIIALGTYKGNLPKTVTEDGTPRTTGDTEQAVRDAIDAGYRHFDCALIYGNEQNVGDGIRAKIAEGVIKREDVFITSKLWNTFLRPELVEKACRLSLQKLGFDYLDLYLVHWPTAFKAGVEYFPKNEKGELLYEEVDLVDVWKAMEDLVAKGLVKSIGVSNYNSEQLKRTVRNAKIIPAVNQVEASPYINQKKLNKLCKELGIVLTAYSPFGNPGRSSVDWQKEKNVLEDPVLIAIGKKHNKDAAQVILRYLIHNDVVPLPKSVTKHRIISNFDVFDFELTPEELSQIDALNKNKRTVLFEGAKNHPEYPFNLEY